MRAPLAAAARRRASDADAVELSIVDLRWQMVQGCLGASEPAFSQGALFELRQRMIRHDMDQRLLERTRELAHRTTGLDPHKLPETLRVAVDSAPREGAGRVEAVAPALLTGLAPDERVVAERLRGEPRAVAKHLTRWGTRSPGAIERPDCRRRIGGYA